MIKTPAKINLYLNIKGKREDGYHLLESLMVYTDLYDEVEIIPAEEFSLEVRGPFATLAGDNKNNIVTKAFHLMQKESGLNKNVVIKLLKNIPVGAGMGGGSSDAAAILITLNELWQLNYSKEKLCELGLKLGADLPIFINRHAAVISGIGEKIEQVQYLPKLYAILVYPHICLSAQDVYKAYKYDGIIDKNSNTLNLISLDYLKEQKNDLESAAISLFPEITKIIQNLAELPFCQFARMTGSGSTCFAIFSNKEKAKAALGKVKELYPDFWVEMVTIHEKF